MKKNYLLSSMLCILFLSLSLLTYAYTPLLTPEKEWDLHYYRFSDNDYVTTCIYKLGGDSTINDVTYRKLLVCEEKTYTQFSLEGLIREDVDQQKVYFKEKNKEEHLYYDFNVAVNDTIKDMYIPKVGSATEDYRQLYIVKDIVNSDNQRTLMIEVQDFYSSNGEVHSHIDRIYWTEGVGCHRSLLSRVIPCYTKGIMSTSCVFDGMTQIYDDRRFEYHNCKEWNDGTGLKETHLQQAIQYDNETHCFSFPYAFVNQTLSIYNMTGKCVSSSKIVDTMQSVDLKSGIYVVVIQTQNQMIHTKICVE